ncbi:hypothetical protein PVK06_012121 [Gossypium arboreum]|uniref:Uncharacterized protein n=1 Tax=Gossypium arboreum TaxID=29729 RepID=A0ABR0QAN1_GOSAR|nr:hypothetical protein PVK06_012121 [Gossypium arboreum]
MDITTILGKVHAKERVVSAPSKKVSIKKNQKRPKVSEESHVQNVDPPLDECLTEILNSRASQKAELDGLRQSSEKAFRKYQEDTTKNLTEALLELRSDLVLHTQVASNPMNLSEVDFNFFKDISTNFLSFTIYHPEGKDWKVVQTKWKQMIGFLVTNTLETKMMKRILKIHLT